MRSLQTPWMLQCEHWHGHGARELHDETMTLLASTARGQSAGGERYWADNNIPCKHGPEGSARECAAREEQAKVLASSVSGSL